MPLLVLAEPAAKAVPSELFKNLGDAHLATASRIMKPGEKLPEEIPCDFCPSARTFRPANPIDGFGLTRDEIKKVSEYFAKSLPVDLNTRLKTCKFQPGIKFTFTVPSENKTGKDKWPNNVVVLLCLNCDVWAIVEDYHFLAEPKPKPDIVYTDARPFRAELLMFKERLDKMEKDL